MGKAHELYDLAAKVMPGGVTASTRLNRAIGCPFYVSRGDGSRIYDLSGREYVDMCMSHGASILGHNHPKIKEAVMKAVEMGIVCSYETEFHYALAKRITDLVPCAEMVRFAGSGTETVMHTLRLAREYTGKDKIIKFEGHFHGYNDYVLFSSSPPSEDAGPADAPRPCPDSGGIPLGIKEYVVVAPFNDIDALERIVKSNRDQVGALIMEPVAYNAGCIVPTRDYMRQVRRLATEYDVLLVFDEVLTAFRLAPGGAQEYFGVVPDLAILGKAIGGGLPISAFCGKREIMEHVKPVGNAQHSGTYMGHLIPVLGALACLEEVSKPGFFERLSDTGARLYGGIKEIVSRHRIRARLQYAGPRFNIYFGIDPEVEVSNFRIACQQDAEMTLKFVRKAIENGVYFHDYHGEPAHHGFSAAHTIKDVDRALEGIDAALCGA